MKRYLGICLVLLVGGLFFSGCGGDAAKEEPAVSSTVVNPLDVVEEAAFADRLGYTLCALDGAENVEWHVIADGGMGEIGELVFTYDGLAYVYRAQPTAELKAYDMSGLYYEWKAEVPGLVSGREAVVCTGAEAGYVMWLDVVPGFNYNLAVVGEDVPAETLLEVAEMVFVPLQGEVDGAAPEEAAVSEDTAPEELPEYDAEQYAGVFEDRDSAEGTNQVRLTPNGDGTFAVEVSLFRLALMTGVGSLMDGALELALEDPNGNAMYAVFYPEGDGAYSLLFSQSDWDLLESGTVFPGFKALE